MNRTRPLLCGLWEKEFVLLAITQLAIIVETSVEEFLQLLERIEHSGSVELEHLRTRNARKTVSLNECHHKTPSNNICEQKKLTALSSRMSMASMCISSPLLMRCESTFKPWLKNSE